MLVMEAKGPRTLMSEKWLQPVAPNQKPRSPAVPNSDVNGARAMAPEMESETRVGVSLVQADPVRRAGWRPAAANRLNFGHSGDESFGIEDGFLLEHEVDGACEFDREYGVGLELVAAKAGLEALGEGTDDGVIAFGDHSRFAESPAQIRIAFGCRSCGYAECAPRRLANGALRHALAPRSPLILPALATVPLTSRQ